MKIQTYYDSGANIHSSNKRVIDVEKDLGISEGEWNSYTEEEKDKMIHEWWMESGYVNWGWEVQA